MPINTQIGNYRSVFTAGFWSADVATAPNADFLEIFTRGWWSQVDSLPYKISSSTKYYTTLAAGDKIRIVAKTTNGTAAITTPEAFRVKLRKKI